MSTILSIFLVAFYPPALALHIGTFMKCFHDSLLPLETRVAHLQKAFQNRSSGAFPRGTETSER